MSPGRGGTFANRLSRRSKCWPRRTSRLSMPESSGEIPAYLHAVKRECPPRRDVSYLYCHQPRPDVRRSASGHLGRTRCSVKELMVLWTKRKGKQVDAWRVGACLPARRRGGPGGDPAAPGRFAGAGRSSCERCELCAALSVFPLP